MNKASQLENLFMYKCPPPNSYSPR